MVTLSKGMFDKTFTVKHFMKKVMMLILRRWLLGLSKSSPYPGTLLDGIVSFDSEVWGWQIKYTLSMYNSNLEEAFLE